ncbi:MarR family winged helix-turn-helix transcriptional regulator [Gordonia neofelifaecis]|uniref:Regulatory protein MarR n=1 Tax=Gordonia neofelifaecis NRRL B-59395 TaxID=644548 RepID=F1YLQ3_9ACTN|nr:MarR family transcriptional regulator [Gordonia neofelifaecis]EGD54447.1 regulatory protein MarR [Gordonia neofelifaecis NRRL B-59395]
MTATPERLDEMFVALSRYTRLRARALHTDIWNDRIGSVETAAYRALFVLRHGPMRSRDLAERLVTDPSTTSRHVAQLVKEGFVRREAHPEDGRASRLVLTDDGHAKVCEIAESRRRLVGETVADWTDEEFDTFVELLGRFVDAVETRIAPCTSKGDS